MLFNAGGGSAGQDLLLEITFKPARHGEVLFETMAGAHQQAAHVMVSLACPASLCEQDCGVL